MKKQINIENYYKITNEVIENILKNNRLSNSQFLYGKLTKDEKTLLVKLGYDAPKIDYMLARYKETYIKDKEYYSLTFYGYYYCKFDLKYKHKLNLKTINKTDNFFNTAIIDIVENIMNYFNIVRLNKTSQTIYMDLINIGVYLIEEDLLECLSKSDIDLVQLQKILESIEIGLGLVKEKKNFLIESLQFNENILYGGVVSGNKYLL